MLDRLWKSGLPGASFRLRLRKTNERPSWRPWVESLENRRLLTASLAPISNLSVPAKMGYQLPLDGSGTSDPQTFTATSSNPDIQVSVAQGPFWTLTASHQASPTSPGDVTFTDRPMTFELFQDLTPNTVDRITNFTNDGYYTQIGKYFPRVNPSFVAQGGSDKPDSLSSSSGVPPIANEVVQQLAFNGSSQLAMANGLPTSPISNDAQFFITYGSQTGLDYGFTLFGQLVSGQQTLTDMANVPRVVNSSYPDGTTPTQPATPITITSASLSPTNPNGVLLIDTTSATTAGQTANITVTATDSRDHTTVTRTFTVTTVAYNGPNDPPINFIPTANPVSASTPATEPNIPVQLSATSNYPDTAKPGTFTFSIVKQPAHGTITQFNPTTGSLVYVPGNYVGPDSFQYVATSTGSATSAPASPPSLPATVSLNVTAGNTGAVRQIDGALVVDPLPRTDHGTNNIQVTQVPDATVSGGQKIQVVVNGIPDGTRPPSDSLIRLIVFGSKASDQISVDPSVTVPATLDGGHGGKNIVKGGGGQALEHGWFGHTLLVGGVGTNQLIGRKAFARFQPSSTTNWIFAGEIRPRSTRGHTKPPKGTFYRFEHGRLVPVFSLPS